MLTPDLTYSFRQPKDVSGPTFELFSRSATVTDTATAVVFTVTDLPKDRMLVLSNVTVFANPGAGQALSGITVDAVTAARLGFAIARLNPVPLADANIAFNWQGQVFVLGGGADSTLLTVTATFDAGVNANAIVTSVHGVVIPRANASPF